MGDYFDFEGLERKLSTVEEYNERALEAYNGKHSCGIECPQCHKEMYWANKNIITTTYPPQREIYCDCGYVTNIFY